MCRAADGQAECLTDQMMTYLVYFRLGKESDHEGVVLVPLCRDHFVRWYNQKHSATLYPTLLLMLSSSGTPDVFQKLAAILDTQHFTWTVVSNIQPTNIYLLCPV